MVLTVIFSLPGTYVFDAVSGPFLLNASELPSDLGRSIYRTNESSTNQLYIIGIAHRDTFTGENNDYSIRSQIEVYRIAEWLIQNREIELLLPEGYFRKPPGTGSLTKREIIKGSGSSRNTTTLRKMLDTDEHYINAEILLMANYGMRSRQIEDKEMLAAVRNELRLLDDESINKYEALHVMSNITYLQARRTAAMLQKIPDVINDELAGGSIINKKAIFTVGLSHLADIIGFLEKKQINIQSPAFHLSYKDLTSKLKLLQDNYGITVIIPNSLEENRDLVRLTAFEQ